MLGRTLFLAAVVTASAALIFTPGCSSSGPPAYEGGPVRVVCTTTIVADLVQHVGGDRVQVETIMGAGVDPHRYQPAPSDIRKLESAHLVFFNGLHLEGKMTDTFEKSGGRMRAFAVTRDIPPSSLREAEPGSEAHYDPHVWFDVKLWAECIEVVRAELTNLDPAGADAYRKNAGAYATELAELDAEIRVKLNAVLTPKRVLVTSHDAFGYFGRAYGYEVRGLQGVSTASETGTTDVQNLAAFLGKNRIPAMFTETSTSEGGLKAVLDVCERDFKHKVALIGGDDALFSDALGEPGSPGGTYPGMIRHNVHVIAGALSK
ncbi:MAG: zinc ABC transporter substrate-binding protein [Gemmataceae bacterium]